MLLRPFLRAGEFDHAQSFAHGRHRCAYKRLAESFSCHDTMEPIFLTLDEVQEMHEQQIGLYGGSHGVCDLPP